MREYYKVLGLEVGASDEQVEKAYKELKEKYSEERFLEGQAGNDAAKMLTKVETAYNEIKASKARLNEKDLFENDYTEVENLIRSGNISLAQQKLDDFSERDAEWHYLQSVVFYKKNWINESLKQLEIALTMDPHNTKYSDALSKLKQKIEYNNKQFYSNNAYNQDPNANRAQQMGGVDSNNCLSLCATWCLMDMLCSMCCR